MTKQQFDTDFKLNDLKFIAKQNEQDGIPDRPGRRQAYNNKLDRYCRDGLIKKSQANKWCITDSLETTKYWL